MSEMSRTEFGAAIAEDLASGEKNTVAEVRIALNNIMDSAFVKQDDTTNDITEGNSNLFFTNERVDDRVAQLLQPGANVSITYDDVAGTITIASVGGGGGGAGAVLVDSYNAHTILAAVTDNNPTPLTITEGTIVGRLTGGNIAALSVSQILTLLNVTAGANPTNAANVEAAGAVMKSIYDAHTILAANADNTPLVVTVNEDTIVGRKNGGNISALSPTDVRTIVNVEDGATNNAGLSLVEISNSDESVPNLITVSENGKTFTNEGVLTLNYHTLPSSGVGQEFTFVVMDTDGIRVTVGNAAHIIRVGELETPTGGYIEATAPGSSITLKRINATTWIAKHVVGLWTVSEYIAPPDGGVGEGTIIDGLVALWDAKAYTTGQTFSNTTSDTDYQTGKTDYDLWLGSDGTATSNDLTFNGNSFEAVGDDDYFRSKSASPAKIANAHKTQTNNSWMFWIKLRTPTAVPTIDTIISTAANTGDRGFRIRSDSGGALKFDHFDGTTIKTVQAAQKLLADKRYDLFVGYDHNTNLLKFGVHEPTTTPLTSFQEVTANLTATTGDATYANFTIGADADLTSSLEEGVKIFGFAWIDHCMTNAEISPFLTWSESRYSPEAVTGPDTPTRILSMAGDGKAYFNLVVENTGGASISDFNIQKKLVGESDSAYTNHSHTASGALDITVDGLTNDQGYVFRFATVTVGGTSDWSEAITVTPVAEGTNPYDEQYYKITEPVTTSGHRIKGTGIVSREITQPALLTYSSAFFGRANGKFIFQCPNYGATTSSNAKYTRSELRHLTNIANNTASEDTLKFAVTQLQPGHKTIVHQIHGYGVDDAPYFKVVVSRSTNGSASIYVLAKLTPTSGDIRKTLVADYNIGDVVTLRAVFSGTTLAFYVNGSTTPIYVPTSNEGTDTATFTRTTEYYWKRGNYYQNLEGDSDGLGGTWGYAVCIVEHYTQSGQYVP